MKLSTASLFKQLNMDSQGCVKVEGEILKKYQSTILHIAMDIIAVCEENNIHYHLTGGSALGAIRHKGFIPWDDDIDIDILGSDFDRFCKLLMVTYPDKYWIHTVNTPNYGITVNRVRLKNSICRAREEFNDENGFFVDVLRIENTYNGFIKRNIHGFLCMATGFLLSCRNFYHNRVVLSEVSSEQDELKKIFKIKIWIGRLVSFKSVNSWARFTQRIYSMCKDNYSLYVTVPAGRKHFYGELRKRSDFVLSTKAEFEGHVWNVPRAFDSYLRSMYGDYMQLPPENEREFHIVSELRFPDEY